MTLDLPSNGANWTFWFPNIVLIVAYISIAVEKVPKVASALLGASMLMISHYLSQEEAFASIDLNVILLLVGMMILVNTLNHTGALNALAIITVRATRGSPTLTLFALSSLTAVLSAMFDNVTTVLLVASVTLAVADQLKLNPVPYLVCETICSNVGGTATLIGDPPNIMIGSAARLGFNDFLLNVAPVIMLVFPLALAIVYFLYRDKLKLPGHENYCVTELSVSGTITNHRLLIVSVITIALVFLAFMFQKKIGLEAGTIAMTGAAFLLLFESRRAIWDDVEWTTIFFFIGLFIMVGGVVKAGTIHALADNFVALTGSDRVLMPLSLLWISGFASAVIDNVPYTATMIPLVSSIQAHTGDGHVLWWALALGACLGGNGSMVGAAANVLIADLLRRNKIKLSFFEFMRVGGLVMIVSLAVCSVYLWLRYLM